MAQSKVDLSPEAARIEARQDLAAHQQKIYVAGHHGTSEVGVSKDMQVRTALLPRSKAFPGGETDPSSAKAIAYAEAYNQVVVGEIARQHAVVEKDLQTLHDRNAANDESQSQTTNPAPADVPQEPITDEAIAQRILQTWNAPTQWPTSTVPLHFHGTTSFAADGKFITKGFFTLLNDKEPMNYKGTWQIRDGFLIETVTGSDSKAVPVGTITRDKVLRVNDDELVYKTEQGGIVTRKRKVDD